MSIGDNIKKRREQLGRSQTDIAEQAGVTQAMMGYIEQGKRMPSLQTAAWIAEALDCSLDELVNGGKRE